MSRGVTIDGICSTREALQTQEHPRELEIVCEAASRVKADAVKLGFNSAEIRLLDVLAVCSKAETVEAGKGRTPDSPIP